MNYSLNISKLLNDYLRPLYNKPKTRAYLESVLWPVMKSHERFLAFRVKIDAEVTITCEVNRLRRALRDKFGDETIEIIHPQDYLNKAYIYLIDEPKPDESDYLATEQHEPVEYDYLAGEYDSQYDYYVRIPASLAPVQDKIYSFVNQYNFADKRFSIEII